MKVFLDEGVPERLARHLAGHEVQNIRVAGMKGISNGRLLEAVASGGFDAFITNDKNMEAEQNLSSRPFAILILSACNLPVILPHIDVIRQAVDSCRPGMTRHIECGRFSPRSRARVPGP